MSKAIDRFSLAHAETRAAADPLQALRERFYRPIGQIYLDGNSLGLASRDAEAAILAALVVLPSVLYRSSQLLDLERLSRAARERDIPIGFDCSHSVGIVPHRLHDWRVDFAFGGTYR